MLHILAADATRPTMRGVRPHDREVGQRVPGQDKNKAPQRVERSLTHSQGAGGAYAMPGPPASMVCRMMRSCHATLGPQHVPCTAKTAMSLGARWFLAALLIAPLGSASTQRPARPPNDPILRVGDALRITVWRQPELSGEFVVAPDSTLVHPVYQAVQVAGAPLPVVKERLRSLLVTYDQDVRLVVEPLFPVTVAGEVRQPNLYRVPQGTTFAQAGAPAGGAAGTGRVGGGRGVS